MSNLILILQNLKKEMLILCISTYIYQSGLHWKTGIVKTKKNNSTQTDAKLSAFFREGYIFSNWSIGILLPFHDQSLVF